MNVVTDSETNQSLPEESKTTMRSGIDLRICSFRRNSSFSSLSSSMYCFFRFRLSWAERRFAARLICFLSSKTPDTEESPPETTDGADDDDDSTAGKIFAAPCWCCLLAGMGAMLATWCWDIRAAAAGLSELCTTGRATPAAANEEGGGGGFIVLLLEVVFSVVLVAATVDEDFFLDAALAFPVFFFFLPEDEEEDEDEEVSAVGACCCCCPAGGRTCLFSPWAKKEKVW